ncbi:MAG: hypothetical protein WCP57_09995 [Bacteroidota bacterium]
MKNRLFILIIVIVAIGFQSCKKCYTCTPICNRCVYGSTHEDICRSGFNSFDDYTSYLNTYKNSGYACTEIDSTTSQEEICGNSTSVAAANAATKASNGYRCTINK